MIKTLYEILKGYISGINCFYNKYVWALYFLIINYRINLWNTSENTLKYINKTIDRGRPCQIPDSGFHLTVLTFM